MMGIGTGTEQWDLNGECSKCRRQEYCHKTCKRHKERVTNIIKSHIYKTFIDLMMK